MPVIRAYCQECDRSFYVVDDPSSHHSHRCPVCLAPGRVLNEDTPHQDTAAG